MEVGDLAVSGFIPYTNNFINGSAYSVLTFSTMGSITTVYIIVLSLISYKTLSPRNWLLFSLAFSEGLFCVHLMLINFTNVIHGGWAVGFWGCILSGFITYLTVATSLYSLAAITLERYVSIVMMKSFTVSHCRQTMCLVWGLGLALALYPFYTLSYAHALEMDTSMAVCSVSWSSRMPIILVLDALAVIVMGATIT
jgi:c-opsin